MRTLPFYRFTAQLALGAIALFLTATAVAQPLTDGFSKAKGTGDVFVSYSWERYDEFYNGDSKGIAPPPYGSQITTQSVSLYGVYGITDDLNVVASLPYINAKGDGTTDAEGLPVQKRSGIQDLEVMVKYRFLYKETEQGRFSLLGTASAGAPLTDYEANDVISIGNHAPSGNLNVIAHYIAPQGIFGELQGGYSFRGEDGSDNDVPNATLLSAKVGYAGSKFYADLWTRTQISASDAVDIGMGIPFSTTRVNYTQLGVTGFVPVGAGIGISAGFARYLTGRNLGLSNRVSIGVGYSF